MINSYSTRRSGGVTTVSVASSLSGDIFYFWYLDGVYLGVSKVSSWTIYLVASSQAQIECIDSNDSTFDPIANAPQGFSAVRELQFVRSIDPSIFEYEIQQQVGGAGGWTTIGTISDDPKKWSFTYTTQRLDDLTIYSWRIVPQDASSNSGTPATLSQELVVRNPDSPKYKISFDAPNGQIRFTAA